MFNGNPTSFFSIGRQMSQGSNGEGNQLPTNRRLFFSEFSPCAQNSNSQNTPTQSGILMQPDQIIPNRSETASPSFRRIDFDIEAEKENIPPRNPFMKQNTGEAKFILQLKKGQSDCEFYQEDQQKSYPDFGFFYSQGVTIKQPASPQKTNNVTSFALFNNLRMQKSESLYSNPSSNFDNNYFHSQGTTVFEEACENDDVLDFTKAENNFAGNENRMRFQSDENEVDSVQESSEVSSVTFDFSEVPLMLETIKNLKNPELNTISCETFVKLFHNNPNRPFLIVDCRYDYEYSGGHIYTSINIRSPELLERVFFTHRTLLMNPDYLAALKQDFDGVIADIQDMTHFPGNVPEDAVSPIIVFHCEFSQKRGPRALRALRDMDRRINKWPNLYYNDIYVLEGGYKNFHSQYPQYCDGGYTTMVDKRFKRDFCMNKEYENKHWKKKNCLGLGGLPGLIRSKTMCDF